MTSTLLVFPGAGIGGVLRHGVNLVALKSFGPGFPVGTFAINIVGSGLMGIVAGWLAFKAGEGWPQERGSLTPPKTILNAPTKLMKQEGYGADYAYDHDAPDAFSGQDYWPDALGRQLFYDPPERGFEHEIRKRLEYWEKLRSERGEG